MKNFKEMDLQLFSEDIEVEEVEQEDLEEVEVEEEDKETNLLDLLEKDEGIQKQFQSEMDRAIQRAIATRDKKHKEELKKQEQRANMTASELQAEKERELEEREQKLHEYELKLAKVEYFKENELNLDLLDYVNGADIDEVKEKASGLTEIINSLVESEVKNRLKVNGVGMSEEEMTPTVSVEDLADLSLEEINSQWDNLIK